jgi:hypothetical protein
MGPEVSLVVFSEAAVVPKVVAKVVAKLMKYLLIYLLNL